MNTIKINGVGYNIDAMQKLSKEQFMALPAHVINLKRVVKEKKQQVLDEAWEILSSKFKQDGNINGNGAQDKATQSASIPAGRRDDTANKRVLPQSKRNATGDGPTGGQETDNTRG